MGEVTAEVNHFTVFAVLAKIKETPAVVDKPGPETGTALLPAVFRFDNLSIDPSKSSVFSKMAYVIRTGDEAAIAVDVTNDGEQTGTCAVTLMINGENRETKEITLAGGQTGRVSFTVTADKPGIYAVQVGSLSGDFIKALWINWWLWTGTVLTFAALCWLTVYLIRKRRASTISD